MLVWTQLVGPWTGSIDFSGSERDVPFATAKIFGPSGLSVLPLVGVSPFFNSGAFDIEDANLYTFEMAWALGQAILQAEYRWGRIRLPAETATVHEGYATWRSMITEKKIQYSKKPGVLDRVKPGNLLNPACGRRGAWEFALRVSTIDITNLFGIAGVVGPTRDMTITTVGVNRYWWENAKCQLQISHTD